jgi:hypothetical protein
MLGWMDAGIRKATQTGGWTEESGSRASVPVGPSDGYGQFRIGLGLCAASGI